MHYLSKRTVFLSLMMILLLVAAGCSSSNVAQNNVPAASETETSVAVSALKLHPASPETVATSTEPLGAFSLDEIGPSDIVDVAFVESKVGASGWVIIDARSAEDYAKGHIPGAINFGGKGLVTVLKHPMDGRVLPAEKFAKIMSEMGISNDMDLIVYGKANDYHVFIEGSPLYYGAKSFHYMNGGYEAWQKAGKSVETVPVKLSPATFTAKVINPNMYVSTYQMAEIASTKDSKYYLIDVRSKDEYNGIGFGTTRAGRIPGAHSYSVDINMNKEAGVLAVDKFAELYKDVPKDKTVIVYCHRGCRTAFSFLALRGLGYKDVRVYEDSFVVYGNWLDLPVEEEHFLNLRGDFKTSVERAEILWKEAGKS